MSPDGTSPDGFTRHSLVPDGRPWPLSPFMPPDPDGFPAHGPAHVPASIEHPRAVAGRVSLRSRATWTMPSLVLSSVIPSVRQAARGQSGAVAAASGTDLAPGPGAWTGLAHRAWRPGKSPRALPGLALRSCGAGGHPGAGWRWGDRAGPTRRKQRPRHLPARSLARPERCPCRAGPVLPAAWGPICPLEASHLWARGHCCAPLSRTTGPVTRPAVHSSGHGAGSSAA